MNATILLMENEPAILELLVINVMQCGYRVARAHDAADAMAHISRAWPDPA